MRGEEVDIEDDVDRWQRHRILKVHVRTFVYAFDEADLRLPCRVVTSPEIKVASTQNPDGTWTVNQSRNACATNQAWAGRWKEAPITRNAIARFDLSGDTR
ncbi:MAG TPA: hypothetical protein VF188_04145 [Longimicrobiales bacterium]